MTRGWLAGRKALFLAGAEGRLRVPVNHLPAVVFDRDQMRASLETLRGLQRAGARIFYGHDPDFWSAVPQAPAEVR